MGTHRFTNCTWALSTAIIVNSSNATDIHFVNCDMGVTKGLTEWLDKTDGSMLRWIFSGCHFPAPVDATNPVIHIQTVTASSVLFTGCAFQTNSTHPFIISADATFSCIVVGCDLVDDDAAYISGSFLDSVFGPNIPPDFDINVSGGSGNLYIGLLASLTGETGTTKVP